VGGTTLTLNPDQSPADAAVVLPTILRPSLLKAVRSVYAQNFQGRIHLLIGVDIHQGDRALLDTIRAECPDHISVTILDPGYSTSVRHGGVHANAFGGSLRTVLSYLANSQHVAYLDDNDWWAANHLTQLKTAITGKDWAWSGRWLVHPESSWPICRDEWDSVGPGKGINAERYGGFVQPSGLMMDARACHFLMPLWSLAAFADGGGEDRLIFDHLLKNHAGAGTDQFTSFCTLTQDSLRHSHHKHEFLARGLDWIYDAHAVNTIESLIKQAHESIANNQIQDAQHIVSKVLALNPNSSDALYLSSKIKYTAGLVHEAIMVLAQAIEVDDLHPSWLLDLATYLGQATRFEEENRVLATIDRRFRT